MTNRIFVILLVLLILSHLYDLQKIHQSLQPLQTNVSVCMCVWCSGWTRPSKAESSAYITPTMQNTRSDIRMRIVQFHTEQLIHAQLWNNDACSGYCDLSIYVIHNGFTGQISLVFMQIIQVVCILHRLHEWKLHLILRYALIVHICATNRLYIWVRRGQCNIGSHWMFLPTIAIVFDWEGGSAATI